MSRKLSAHLNLFIVILKKSYLLIKSQDIIQFEGIKERRMTQQ